MNRRGFTLVETLIYVALFASSIAVLSSVFVSSLRTDRMTEQQHELLQARRLVEVRLRETIEQAASVSSPSSGTTTSLAVAGAAFANGTQTFTVTDGILYYQDGSAAAVPITPSSLTVSAFTATRIATSPPGVQVSFTISSNDQEVSQTFDSSFSAFLRYE